MNQRIASTIGFAGSVAAASLAAALISGQARAEGPIENIRPATGALTRAEVKADLMNHRAQVSSYASEWVLQQGEPLQAASGLTREQVRAAYIESREEVRAMTAEHGGSGHFAVMRAPAPVTAVASGGLR